MMHYMSIDQQSNQCTHEHTEQLDFIHFHVIFIRNKQIKFKKTMSTNYKGTERIHAPGVMSRYSLHVI